MILRIHSTKTQTNSSQRQLCTELEAAVLCPAQAKAASRSIASPTIPHDTWGLLLLFYLAFSWLNISFSDAVLLVYDEVFLMELLNNRRTKVGPLPGQILLRLFSVLLIYK